MPRKARGIVKGLERKVAAQPASLGGTLSRPMLTFQHRKRRAGDRDLVSSEATVDIVIQSKRVPGIESVRATTVREVRSQCPEAACKVPVSYLLSTLR